MEETLLTVTSFYCNPSCDAVDNEEAHNMTAVVFNEALELLHLLLDWVLHVLLTLGLHVDVWGFYVKPKSIKESLLCLSRVTFTLQLCVL